MAEISTTVTLAIYRGGKLRRTVTRSEESITIGAGADALVVVDGDDVGELHATLNRNDDGSISVLDLGTESGTLVNGERISSNATLQPGDRVGVGEIEIVVSWEQPDAFDDEAATVVNAAPTADEPAPVEEDLASEPEPLASSDREDPADAATPIAAPTVDPDPVYSLDEEADEPARPPVAPKVPQPEGGFKRREDVLQFILQSNVQAPQHPTEKNRPKVLEVNQIWNDTLLDTQHFALDGDDVTIGATMGYRWSILGVPLAWVPGALKFVLTATPPVLSEVNAEWKASFYAPDGNLPDGHTHKLFVWEGDTYVARVAKGWAGYVEDGNGRKSFGDLVAAGGAKQQGDVITVPMSDDRRLMVDVDGITFFAHNVHGARRVDRAAEVDYLFVSLLTILGFAGGVFGGIMWFAPPPMSTEVTEIPDRFAEVLLEQPPEPEKAKKPDGNPDAGEGAKAKKEEGKVGKKDATQREAQGNKVEARQQEIDREVASSAGILGALSSDPGMAGFGAAGLDASMTGGIGGLIGAKGTQFGSGGLGSRGSGLGGGGTAEGLGGLGTRGMGSGASGYGSGGGDLGQRGEGAIGTMGGDPIILGALDRSLIDEVIKRHMNQIRYCYQRELSRNATLAGKVVIRFTIAGDGTVSQASTKETTMNNSAVEGCIVGRFQRMQFPEPRGGGVVIVSYPFLFSPG
jgi:hypothetical protein